MPDHSEKVMYVGPSRPFGLPLMRNAILAGEPEKIFPALTPFFAEHAPFKKLFVPVPSLAHSLAAMRQPGSALRLWSDHIRAASDTWKAANKQGDCK